MTTQGKEVALQALKERRDNQPKHIDNSSLPAGSPMYFYCISCGWLAATRGELYTDIPPKLCKECRALQDLGWLDE